jgi:hypothetical protein
MWKQLEIQIFPKGEYSIADLSTDSVGHYVSNAMEQITSLRSLELLSYLGNLLLMEQKDLSYSRIY